MWGVAAAWGGTVEMPEEDALTSLRLRSLGGAVSGVAESAASNLDNPAAVAIRRPTAPQRRVDPDVALQVRDHPLLAIVFPHPPPPYRSSYFQVIPNLRIGRVGVTTGWKETRVHDRGGDVGTFLASPGAAVAADHVAVGLLPQILGVQADGRGVAVGFGATAGVLVAPPGPFRAGASLRTPIRTAALRGGGPGAVDRARLPWEAQLGLTTTHGLDGVAGPWGPARARAPGDVAAVLTAELVVTGPTGDAAVLAEGDRARTGAPTTLSPRGGGELWIARDRGRLRGGLGWLPGRGASPEGPYGAASVAWRLFDDPRGFAWRAVFGVERYSPGTAVGVGLETW